MLVRRQLHAHDARGIGRREVDDHTLDHRHDRVARQWVLPRLQIGMADLGIDQIHLADLTLILLEGRDFLRVRRPHEDRTVATGPAGVVGGVAEILDAVGRQRRLAAGRHVAHPEIPVADKRHALRVRRLRFGPLGPARSTSPTAFARGLHARWQHARGARAGDRIDQHGLGTTFGRHPVPEALVAAAQPRRTHAAVEHQRRRVVAHELLCAGIVGRRQSRRRVAGLLS
jgi:hypothetical protein